MLDANAHYVANFGDKGSLPLPPGRRFAILTCMDARLDPAKYAGLAEGDAHVIRNAGGRASDDAIRSLVISTKLLGTREWFLVHHTDCGMQLFTDEVISGLLDSRRHLPPTQFHSRFWQRHNAFASFDETHAVTPLPTAVAASEDETCPFGPRYRGCCRSRRCASAGPASQKMRQL